MIREIWEKIKANWYWLFVILGVFAIILYLIFNWKQIKKLSEIIEETKEK